MRRNKAASVRRFKNRLLTLTVSRLAQAQAVTRTTARLHQRKPHAHTTPPHQAKSHGAAMNRWSKISLLVPSMVYATQALAQNANAGSANSIQPETTITINAEAAVTRAPDIAYITAGVQNEAKSAKEAMASNARDMNGVFKALKAAGIADKDMQTANFSVNPRYDYVQDKTGSGRQVLGGYVASNQVTAKVRKLDTLGTTLDSLVSAGGNTLNGVNFALDDDATARDEARRMAMQSALKRAELYASAAGYKVARIVTINESSQSSQPQPMVMMMRAKMADAEPTPIASGEVGFTANLSVVFELKK
jgi:uncharacterized protein YggE